MKKTLLEKTANKLVNASHLDIRLNWFGTRLDPATILNIQ